ncbi:MAG: tyrosine-type recombinase/integrase [Alphaproteobacteria bacterium]|nr:tyrosine-type recombinase/integrase [Alphaproteobacteria bacterium]
MVRFRMPSLMKREGSGNWYFRQRIPQDVQRILSKVPRDQWPSGWGRCEIWLTTGTSVKAQARIRQGEFLAEVERRLQAYRQGLRPLTSGHISYLSSVVFRDREAALEGKSGEPSPPYSLSEDNGSPRSVEGEESGCAPPIVNQEKPLITGEDARDPGRKISLEDRLAAVADAVLERECIITTPESRRLLIEALAREMSSTAPRPARDADGGGVPEIHPSNFRSKAERNTPRPSFSALIDAWKAHSQRCIETTSQWASIALRFKVLLGHDDLLSITSQDIRRWTDKRQADGVSVRTLRNGDLAALRSVFEFGIERAWLVANPTLGVKVRGPKKQLNRPKYFSSAETSAILDTALAVKPSTRFPKTASARRWVPWLCAYSGARVGEILQLRKGDIRKEGGYYIMRITPDAGSVKTGRFRDVPVHAHLLETGFLTFVAASQDGHLFTDGTSRCIKAERERLRYMVRKVVPDAGVSPNHGWRHSFKTYGHQAGIDSLTLDAICGHAAKTEGEEYTHVTLRTMIKAMHKFPRYSGGRLAKDASDGDEKGR